MDRDPPPNDQMATLLLPNNNPSQPIPPNNTQSGGINKRYRPAPAKTFQCRGYGDCRMVFSRSEHLARHIRKHTGERPFTCHCGKQFSRLDNLRQHAQTVHADKQEQNERMMRDLTSLHASMAAANKATQTRGKRGQATPASSNGGDSGLESIVKQEDMQSSIPMHQRPGTSTGYEGSGPDTNGLMYHPNAAGRTWHVQTANVDRPNARPVNSHSFRDPSQSFRAPSAASTITSSAASSNASAPQLGQPTQSFLASRDPFELGLATDLSSRPNGRSGSSSRPTTASLDPPDAHPRSLPPLAAVVSSSIPPSQWGVPAQSILPVPTGPGIGSGRPSTATRPGTAPAAYFSPSSFGPIGGGPGMGSHPELSLRHLYGRPSELAAHAQYSTSGYPSADLGDTPTSPLGGSAYDSPFSFHPPALAEQSSGPGTSPSAVPRKRPYPGSDDALERGSSSYGYDLAGGSESRPQSRRLSVMELCNDPVSPDALRPLLPVSAGQRPPTGTSRPTTSGLVASASQLALVDHPPPLRTGAAAATVPPAAAPAGAGAARTGSQGFAGRGVYAPPPQYD
ncbi:hypothetical protein EWM64_g10337, partial [Hericium alpestre]